MSDEGRSVRLSEREFIALDAIAWVLAEMQQDPDVYEALTKSSSGGLLVRAYARLRERPLSEIEELVRAKLFEDRGLRPRAEALMEQLQEARARIKELEQQLEEVRHVA